MNAIVMNTLTAAVTEYDLAFKSISPNFAASDAGLLALGGAADAGAKINAHFNTGKTLCGVSVKKAVDTAFASINGSLGSTGLFTIYGQQDAWSYPMRVGSSGESRVKPGRGIRETYLGFGYSNDGGADFIVDRFEINLIASSQRRTSS